MCFYFICQRFSGRASVQFYYGSQQDQLSHVEDCFHRQYLFHKERVVCILWQFIVSRCSMALLFYYFSINYLRLVYWDGREQRETVKQIISNGWNRNSQAEFQGAAKAITAQFPLTPWVIKLNPLKILWNFSLQYLWKYFTVKLYFQFHSQ